MTHAEILRAAERALLGNFAPVRRRLRQSLEPAGDGIGGRLRAARLQRGLSQRDLASPGVSYAYISCIEAGSRNPSIKALRKLAAKLGVSPEWLETGVEPTRWAGFSNSELSVLERALRDADEETVALLGAEIASELGKRSGRDGVAKASASSPGRTSP